MFDHALPYEVRMELPISDIDSQRPIAWAREHCSGKLNYSTFKTQGHRLCYVFCFEYQQDAALFALRWI